MTGLWPHSDTPRRGRGVAALLLLDDPHFCGCFRGQALHALLIEPGRGFRPRPMIKREYKFLRRLQQCPWLRRRT